MTNSDYYCVTSLDQRDALCHVQFFNSLILKNAHVLMGIPSQRIQTSRPQRTVRRTVRAQSITVCDTAGLNGATGYLQQIKVSSK